MLQLHVLASLSLATSAQVPFTSPYESSGIAVLMASLVVPHLGLRKKNRHPV